MFSAYFLTQGVALRPEWRGDAAALADARATVARVLADFTVRAQPNEANTERDAIDPLLELLGWHFSVQEKASRVGRSDVPDYLLFLDAEAKATATRLSAAADRYALGASIAEAKAWNLPLDRTEPGHAGAPSTQMLQYLGTIGVQSNDRLRFGILTNGRLWRLYDNKARSRLEGFVEIDLADLVPTTGTAVDSADDALRTFLFLFAAAAFRPAPDGRTRLDRALATSRDFEARVTGELAETVFERVFPDLADALARHDPQRGTGTAYHAELREAALTWLYRLLFTLYAEDRDLIPTRARRDGLHAMREEVAAARDAGTALSRTRSSYDSELRGIWKQIDAGDTDIGLPPYNGGLFRAGRSALLDRSLLPDADFAPLLDALSRERTGGHPRMINYRDLNVQHLGSVYERLLEYEAAEVGGRIVTVPQTFARKTSGSYYTPEELVLLVIRRTVGPLLEDRRRAFAAALVDPERAGQDPAYRLPWLQHADPATAFLSLRILDPAMGSGHFLVSLVDYLADEVMLATREAAELVEGYRSPLLDRLEAIRGRIRDQAREHGWKVEEAQLIDRQLVRRIILKRVIHGVDKNPMAVEFAKLSLWLHTFTVGAPLSFLDHHLRCGESLFGEWVIPGMARLERGGLYKRGELDQAVRAIGAIEHVEDLTDADITEVHDSKASFDDARAQIRPLERFFDLLQGYRWIEGSAEDALKRAKAVQKQADRSSDPAESLRLTREAWNLRRRGTALDTLLEGDLGPPDAVLDQCYGRIGGVSPLPLAGGVGGGRSSGGESTPEDSALAPLVRAAEISAVSNFLHWELAFPTVWRDWLSPSRRSGGFDAVIGNPPWDRLKLQQVEWFAARAPAIAKATRAADRARMIRELTDTDAPLARQYAAASEMAALAARVAGLKGDAGGEYPLLGGGDVNLYSLFVERAGRLVKPDGLVGLLTPSGIAGDLGAARFFRSVSTTGRLGALLDYANRPAPGMPEYFPDVDSPVQVLRDRVRRRRPAVRRGRVRVLPVHHPRRRAGRRRLSARPVGLRGRQPQHRHRPRLPHPPRRGADHRHLCPPARAGPPRGQRGATGRARLAGALCDDVPHDQRQPPVPHGGGAGSGRLVSGRGRALAQGRGGGGAVVRGQDGAGVRSPRRERGGERGEPAPSRPARGRDGRAASGPVVDAQPAVLGRNLRAADRPGQAALDDRLQGCDGADQHAYDDCRRRTLCGIWQHASHRHLDASRPRRPARQLQRLRLRLSRATKDAGPASELVHRRTASRHPAPAYDRCFGALTARAIVAREVLRLTYTAHDMAPFARDMGYDGAPFAWNDADRRQRRARLDALYFHLYALTRDEADYVLSTFPIVRRQDEAAHGRFLTRDLILAHMAALDAGDTDAVIALR